MLIVESFIISEWLYHVWSNTAERGEEKEYTGTYMTHFWDLRQHQNTDEDFKSLQPAIDSAKKLAKEKNQEITVFRLVGTASPQPAKWEESV